jgi:hypothetical protein
VDLDEKRIFFVISPHINYYHSYRGDSKGPSGFGHDVRMMAEILSQIEAIEAGGLCGGIVRITWDYADLFWSVQLQQEYQPDILQKVIERCRAGKDEALIGSWGNVAPSWLDAEEFRVQDAWNLENTMGIGLKQLFSNRVAPYARTQEMMFTQGMIEEYNRLGIEGLCVYYSAIPFDNGRPFLKPRLDWNQRHGLLKFNSTVSDASMLMIPTYGFGDALDHLSIKSWFKEIRQKQETGEIRGHALVNLNFDMDAETWTGMDVPRFLRWMPNTRGLWELAEAVDAFDYVEFANLLDVIPKLVSSGHVYGETTLKPDVADGCFNGYYNWAQKHGNTKFWTVSQRARYLKCIADNLTGTTAPNSEDRVNAFLRHGDDTSDTYLRNRLLFTSTTHFGMAMPLNHPHRDTTAALYAWKHYQAAEKAATLALEETVGKILGPSSDSEETPRLLVFPVWNRGVTELEQKPVHSPVVVKVPVPPRLVPDDPNAPCSVTPVSPAGDAPLSAGVYMQKGRSDATLEMVLPPEYLADAGYFIGSFAPGPTSAPTAGSRRVEATSLALQNDAVALRLSQAGHIASFSWDGLELACPGFLETAVSYGKSPEKAQRVAPTRNRVEVLRDGSDGISAAVSVGGEFEIRPGSVGQASKVLTLYAGIPALFVRVEVALPRTEGSATSSTGASSVQTAYDHHWQEVMPCEVKPNLIGAHKALRIWKHNFLGRVTCFDLDLRDVDPENADVDCLSSAISDGWMAVSDGSYGLLVGFNALEAANPAYAPIKVRDRGFGDGAREGQQIRLNPFGTYYGRQLHHWPDGTGHAQEIVTSIGSTYHSTGPSFNGCTLAFELLLAPYRGDAPPEDVQSLANHVAFPPLALLEKAPIGSRALQDLMNNFGPSAEACAALFSQFDVEDADVPYLEWVRKVNENPDRYGHEMPELNPPRLTVRQMLLTAINGFRGR